MLSVCIGFHALASRATGLQVPAVLYRSVVLSCAMMPLSLMELAIVNSKCGKLKRCKALPVTEYCTDSWFT